MKINTLTGTAYLLVALTAALTTGVATVSAADKKKTPEPPQTESGITLEKKYADQLHALRAEIEKTLPKINEQKIAALAKARATIKSAQAAASVAQQSLSKVHTAKALVDHAKGKWIGDAEKNIAKSEAALKKATTDAERTAAKTELAKWQANKEDGINALKERQAAYDKAKIDEPKLAQANKAAQEELAQAQANELKAATLLLADLHAFLASDKLDAQLVKAAVLAEATPRNLAAFAQQDTKQEALVDRLLYDNVLMKQMLEAGGAKFSQYGRAMEIYSAIQLASPKAKSGNLQLLAMATCLEHAKPIAQSNPKDQANQPTFIDPVQRYLHYEQAYLAGELDPAFKNFSAWEYRMVLDCDAPDEILAWGREMLRNYRPDHIYNPNYGWRYSAAIKTEVPYGSQNVKCDLDTLHNYQNIIMNGGICGRRAFFGRFILQSFGIPTWGVTQHKHAALSHWTPNGWLVNLGAGFSHSWWDKDEVPRSGADFLLETQARTMPQDYMQVLRAQWVSKILGEQAYNHRKNIDGDFWSGIAHYQAQAIATAAKAVDLGPLGQELGEANEAKEKDTAEQVALTDTDRKVIIGRDGIITIPSVAHRKASGHSMAVKSFSGGMQIHCSGGFQAEYDIEVPRAGTYELTALVVTVQVGQQFQFAMNDAKEPVEIAVPYTVGKWQPTQPLKLSLKGGKNVLFFTLKKDSRGVTIKEFTLTPVK